MIEHYKNNKYLGRNDITNEDIKYTAEDVKQKNLQFNNKYLEE